MFTLRIIFILPMTLAGVLNCNPKNAFNGSEKSENKLDENAESTQVVKDETNATDASIDEPVLASPPVEVQGAFLYAGYFATDPATSSTDGKFDLIYKIWGEDLQGQVVSLGSELTKCELFNVTSGKIESASPRGLNNEPSVEFGLPAGATLKDAYKYSFRCDSLTSAEIKINRPAALPAGGQKLFFQMTKNSRNSGLLLGEFGGELGIRFRYPQVKKYVFTYPMAVPADHPQGAFLLKLFSIKDQVIDENSFLHVTLEKKSVSANNDLAIVLAPTTDISKATRFHLMYKNNKMHLMPLEQPQGDQIFVCLQKSLVLKNHTRDDFDGMALVADPKVDANDPNGVSHCIDVIDKNKIDIPDLDLVRIYIE